MKLGFAKRENNEADRLHVLVVLATKKNAAIREVEPFSLPKGGPVLSDKMVYIGTTKNRAENLSQIIGGNGYQREYPSIDHQSF